MTIIDSVYEDSDPVTTLQIFHRRLKVPISVYLEAVSKFTDPWDERAYQYFIQQYLDEIKDPGIVGMVRKEQDTNYVYLDAAIRYPADNAN